MEEKELSLMKKGVRKMANNSKRKLLFIALFLITMLSSAAYTSLIPNACASEVTTQQKAITVLNSVVDLDTAECTTSLIEESKSTLSGLPREEITFKLISSEGSSQVKCSFVNNKLHLIYLSDYASSLSRTKPDATTRDMAKDFMGRYQSYTGNPFYGKLGSMLDGVATNQNLTKTLGNVKLEVSVLGDGEYANVFWTYVDENGIRAQMKNVGMSYAHGRLESFMDNWQFYNVAGVPKLSREEAIAVALKAVENFSWDAYADDGEIVTVSDFEVVSVGNATLSYLNSAKQDLARGGDSFTLYPSWYIPLGFDKFYSGSVTGAVVRVWADTGEVEKIGTLSSGGAPLSGDITPTETGNQSPLWEVLFAISVAIAVVAICFCGIKLRSNRSGIKLRSNRNSQLKSGISKVSVTLICVMLSFSLIFAAIPNANAKRAQIYVSHTGQTAQDLIVMGYTSGAITSLLNSAGYNAFNNYYQTTWQEYYDNTVNDQSYDTFNVVLHYGHMAGPNSVILSDNNVLTYQNVQYFMWTFDWRFRFVWLWACMTANGPSTGMPWAWTYYGFNSVDGYRYPDPVPSCYIGFENMSPSIYDRSFRWWDDVYAYEFLYDVYYNLLHYGDNIHDALNWASYDNFGIPYDSPYEPLYMGYESWWPGNYGDPPFPPWWYPGKMKVYGNSGIYLID